MGLLIRSKISKFLGNLILKENLQLLPSGRLFGIYLQKLRGIVWNDIVLPNIALFCWKVLHRKIPTDDVVATKGVQLASCCSLCNLSHAENIDSLLFL